MSSNLSRRRFLQVSSLTAGTAAAGLTVLGKAAHATSTGLPGLQGRGLEAVDAGIMLLPSEQGQPNEAFVADCSALVEHKRDAGQLGSLESVVARLCSEETVRLYSVAEADRWLDQGGFYASLAHFTRLGGRNVVVFPELNLLGDPHYSTDPRTMAYLALALRRAFWNGGHRGLTTFFPGPASAGKISTGTWHSGLAEYFSKYDLLGRDLKARTFGEAYPKAVDPAIADQTLLNHSGMGVFDGVALAAEGSTLKLQSEWVHRNLDDTGLMIATPPTREATTRRVGRSEFLVTEAQGPMETGIRTAGPARDEAA